MTLAAGEPVAGPASGVYGLRPEDLHDAYELPASAATAQTIGIVDAHDDPTIEADLGVYDQEFSLPACTTLNGCFRKVNQAGGTSPLPTADQGWATEISLDVETAHAVCPNCHIVLVEAESSFFFDLEAAEETAVHEGATEISNSYGGADVFEGSAYDHPGIVITASTGDWGYDNWSDEANGDTANYPAASPDVVAVGGTHLLLSGESWSGETAWSNGGSGCSPLTAAPAWQSAVPDWSAVGCGSMRAVADVAADADPYTGVAIYDSTPDPPYFPGWATMGGTSLSSPLIAAAFALAGGAHGVEYPAQTLYSSLGSSSLHDVVTGTNGACSGLAICNAAIGYDGPTGVGTPAGLGALDDNAGGPPPTVTAISPDHGGTGGGTEVTIEGTNLNNALKVRFGDARATILSDEEGKIVVKSPAREAGTVDVTVVGPYGATSAESPSDLYQYVSPAPPATDTLSFQRSGPGQGQVFISPPGISCASACSQGFAAGTEVRLTADPGTGSTFRGWSGGACLGTGSCEFLLTADTTVVATFETNGSNLPPFSAVTTTSSPPNPTDPSSRAAESTSPRLDACLEAARRAFHRAERAARSAGKRRGAALRRARHLEAAQLNTCRKRFGSSS